MTNSYEYVIMSILPADSMKGAEIMDDRKIAYKDNQANSNAQSPYLEEVAYLLSLLSPSKLDQAVNFLEKLKESEDSRETVSAFRETEN